MRPVQLNILTQLYRTVTTRYSLDKVFRLAVSSLRLHHAPSVKQSAFLLQVNLPPRAMPCRFLETSEWQNIGRSGHEVKLSFHQENACTSGRTDSCRWAVSRLRHIQPAAGEPKSPSGPHVRSAHCAAVTCPWPEGSVASQTGTVSTELCKYLLTEPSERSRVRFPMKSFFSIYLMGTFFSRIMALSLIP